MHIYRNPNISKVKYQVNTSVPVGEGEGLAQYGDMRRYLPLVPVNGHKCAYFISPDYESSVYNVYMVVNDPSYTHLGVINGSGTEEFYQPLADIIDQDGYAVVEINISPSNTYFEAFLVEEVNGEVVRNSVSCTFWILYAVEAGNTYSENFDTYVAGIESEYLVPRYLKIPLVGGTERIYNIDRTWIYGGNSGCSTRQYFQIESSAFDDAVVNDGVCVVTIGVYAKESDTVHEYDVQMYVHQEEETYA